MAIGKFHCKQCGRNDGTHEKSCAVFVTDNPNHGDNNKNEPEVTESVFTDGRWRRHIDHVYRGWKIDKGSIPIYPWNPAWEYEELERRKVEWAKVFRFEVDAWQEKYGDKEAA